MRVVAVTVRDFRCYRNATARFGPGLTVVAGPNGAGKTNLLEALYFGCTGRSCRTTNDREVVRFGSGAARVVVAAEDPDGAHELAVGFVPGEPKRMRVDGANVERLARCRAAPAGQRLSPGSPRAGQGGAGAAPRPPRPIRRPPCGPPASTTRRSYRRHSHSATR